ncbi:MAG: hypothetical protein EBS07_02455 [Sphingobacteriia bacterium]|nr:hypothetical protein [Sphingobacteriia bacterium]
MQTNTLTIPRKPSLFLINLLLAFVVTTLLFFIDDGYYNFNWTLHLSNRVFFVIYIIRIFLGQTLTEKFILKKYNGKNKTILTSLIGVPLGIALLFIIYYSIKP